VAVAWVAAVAAAWGCARPVPPAIPEGEDYVFPTARPGELRPAEAQGLEKAWRKLLAGNPGAAEKGFRKLLLARPGLIPVETGLAYARLRLGRSAEAGNGFAAALARRPEYLPALMGAAAVAARGSDLERALDLLRRAAGAAPDDPRVRRRLAEIKLRLTERRVAEARRAQDAGDSTRAVAAYRQALEAAPEVAGLRLALADLLLAEGDAAGAADTLGADPLGDRQTRLRLAEVLTGLGQYERALDTLRMVLARDPRDAEARSRAREVREALTLSLLPEEYRRIPSAARVSRAELAAILSINVGALARLPPGEPRVAVDIAGSWARSHITRLLALEVMDLFPNHTFQPGLPVRRGDLARAVARVLELTGAPRRPAPAPLDMAPANLAYEAALRVVGAGLMELTPAGAFEPSRPVTGREALDVVEALARASEP
jgi:thioredoxin-like negative regulator of GroEL